jgi:hypothetical protein
MLKTRELLRAVGAQESKQASKKESKQKGQEVREAIVDGSLPLRGFIKKNKNKNKKLIPWIVI